MENKEITKEEALVLTGTVIQPDISNKLSDFRINSWEVLDVVKNKVQDLGKEIRVRWFEIAKLLYMVYRDEGWKFDGCSSWSEWVAENYEYLKIGLRQVERQIRIWDVLIVKLKQPIDEVAALSSTNAYEISRYAKPSNIAELISMGVNLETRALKKTLENTDMENLSSSQIFHCDHEDMIILMKCPKCKEIFYHLSDKIKNITDKDNILSEEKIKKRYPECKVLKDSIN